jgi:hypothetical protein
VGVSSWPVGVDGALIIASQSTASWNRHSAALHSYSKFLYQNNEKISWPFSLESVRSYVAWALKSKNLSAETVKVYLSDFRLAHKLRNVHCSFDSDFFVSSMLKGAKNLSLYKNIFKPAKFVMSYQLLRILGHEIATSNWKQDSKTVFWSACCLAFFGSFRIAEILPGAYSKDSWETLTWNRVHFTEHNSAIINVRFPKSQKKPQGDFIDIFRIENNSCCPLTALSRLRDSSARNIACDMPVFSFNNGCPLTPKVFIDTVRSLLSKHVGKNASQISGHSFRAAIPAALASHPNLATDHEIMIWGRWSSDSYKAYTRLKHEAKLGIFKKIVSIYNL